MTVNFYKRQTNGDVTLKFDAPGGRPDGLGPYSRPLVRACSRAMFPSGKSVL